MVSRPSVASLSSILLCVWAAVASSPRFAVTDLMLVAGISHESTVDVCEQIMAGQSVGTDWGNGNNDRVLELCVQRQRLETLNVSSPYTFLIQRIAIRKKSCRSNEIDIHRSSDNVIVCARQVPISRELIDSGNYLSDIWVSKNRHHSSELPGWTRLAASVEEPAYSFLRRAWHWLWKPTYDGAFITYQRPLLPIREVELVTISRDNDTADACMDKLGVAWEVAGNEALDIPEAKTQEAVVCMRRQAVNSSESNTTVLTDIVIVDKQLCEAPGSTRLALPSDGRSMCMTWSSHLSNGTFLVDLRLEKPPRDLLLGEFERASQLSVGGQGSDKVHLYKQSSWSSLELVEEDPEENGLTSKPPLFAKAATNDTTSSTNTSAPVITFKILQIADLHYSGDPKTSCDDAPNGVKDCNEALMTKFVNELLDVEKPDFVMFSGDNVQVFKKSLRQKAIDAVTVGVEARGIPFAVIFGNHDDEKNFPRRDQMRMYVKKPLAYARSGPKNIDGVGNYELSVQASVDGPWGSAGRTVFRMYFVDSHAYPDKHHGVRDYVSKYDWIKPSQVAYYRQLSQNHSANNDSVPAIMFFHIPLPEYAMETKYLRSKGDRKDEVLSSQVNTNLFSSLVELGEVKATFCGHDHLNDFCFKRDGVQLCYGGGIGMGTAYGDSDIPRRARVIEWSVDGENRRVIRSWRRLRGEVEKKQLEEVLYAA